MPPKVNFDVSLADGCPDSLKYWDYERNEIDPHNVALHSNQRRAWVCEKGHHWESSVNDFSYGGRCPYCSGKRVLPGFNDLMTVNPELAKEWHPTKNGDLKPSDVTAGSRKKVWWLGKCGHEWDTEIYHRISGIGCPICANKRVLLGYNDLATIHPNLALEWDYERNNPLTPNDVLAGSYKKYWWKCKEGHSWESRLTDRIKGNGCPYCSGRFAIIGVNDLLTVNPNLAKEWHPTKNGDLKPEQFKPHSEKKIWWQCKNGHEWEASISSRSSGNGCPYCSGRQRIRGLNDLQTVNPELAAEWHPTKNGNLSPDTISANSNRKVWWQCKNGHEWESQIYNRNNGAVCPFCANRALIPGKNDLQTVNPELAAEWHPTKNGNLKPSDVQPFSNKKAWWRCRYGHEWEALINNRSMGNGCPYCALHFQTSFPEKAVAFNLSKYVNVKENYRIPGTKYELDIFLPDYSFGIEYDGIKYHTDIKRDDIKNKLCIQNNITLLRIREKGLPVLSGCLIEEVEPQSPSDIDRACNRILDLILKDKNPDRGFDTERDYGTIKKKVGVSYEKSLQNLNPELAKEWHPTKNGILSPSDVNAYSNKKIWWICKKGHEWQDSLNHRMKSRNCPFCSNHRVLAGENDLATIFPSIAEEWHPTKNGMLKPTDVLPFSNKKVWWKCKNGHEWEAQINVRSSNVSGCPFCSNYRIVKGKNDLQTVNPELASEWHLTKNGDLKPTDVFPKSNRKVWWNCKNGHEWEAAINNRAAGQRCPYCSNKYVIPGQNDLATINPELVKEWHPTKNGNLKPSDVLPFSNKKVWWKCKNGHEWEAVINSRSNGRGCPYCSNKKVWPGFNDLQTNDPELAAEWHPTKNGDLKPTGFTAGSSKKVWWKCKNGHEWKSCISDRKRGSGCPYCSGNER